MVNATTCTNAPPNTPSNAGIAGAGVILSFVITAVIVILMSASLIVQESFIKSKKVSTVRRKLLNGYSDQQILTGIGIQAVGLTQTGTLVPYHFFIIWLLSLLSMAVHNATLLSLVGDFRRDWVLRWLRQFLMFINLILSCVYGVFMLEVVQKNLETSTLPIGCTWSVDGSKSGTASNAGVSYAGTLAVIVGNCVVFAASTWYLHDRKRRFFRWAQVVGIVLMTAVAGMAIVRVLFTSQAFGTPTTALADQGEKEWSFGSLVGLLLLLLPLMSLLEIARGEMTMVPSKPLAVVAEEDQSGLIGGGNGIYDEKGRRRYSFQPTPFFGRRSEA